MLIFLSLPNQRYTEWEYEFHKILCFARMHYWYKSISFLNHNEGFILRLLDTRRCFKKEHWRKLNQVNRREVEYQKRVIDPGTRVATKNSLLDPALYKSNNQAQKKYFIVSNIVLVKTTFANIMLL